MQSQIMHSNFNVSFSSGYSNDYSRNYLEDQQELLEKEANSDNIKVASEADQGYINRYNLIDRPSGSCNFCEKPCACHHKSALDYKLS